MVMSLPTSTVRKPVWQRREEHRTESQAITPTTTTSAPHTRTHTPATAWWYGSHPQSLKGTKCQKTSKVQDSRLFGRHLAGLSS